MVVTLENHVVWKDDQDFLRFAAVPEDLEQDTRIHGQLELSFDSSTGGVVRVTGVRPVVGRPFLKIEPLRLRAAGWLALEHPVAMETLRDLAQFVPILEAASPQTATLHAILRLYTPDGRFTDASSTQLELRRERRAHALPISLDDIPPRLVQAATKAKLIFLLESREVEIDYFGLRMLGVANPVFEVDDDMLMELREAAAAKGGKVLSNALDIGKKAAAHKLKWNNKLSDMLYLDVDSRQGQAVVMTSANGAATFDFSGTRDSGWRTLELRFQGVENTGATTALIHLEATALPRETTAIRVIVRHYSKRWSTWTDSDTLTWLQLREGPNKLNATIDLSREFPDTQKVHDLGILLFIPPTIDSLAVSSLEGFIHDRREGQGAALSGHAALLRQNLPR